MIHSLIILEHCPRMSRQKYFLEYFSYIIIIIMLLLKTCQVLLEAGDTISDSDIDSILGLGGIDDGLSEEEVGSQIDYFVKVTSVLTAMTFRSWRTLTSYSPMMSLTSLIWTRMTCSLRLV